jgi:hypothetical protein
VCFKARSMNFECCQADPELADDLSCRSSFARARTFSRLSRVIISTAISQPNDLLQSDTEACNVPGRMVSEECLLIALTMHNFEVFLLERMLRRCMQLLTRKSQSREITSWWKVTADVVDELLW